VHEEDAEVAVGRHRLGGDRAVHVGMAARFEHDRAPQSVQVLARVAPLLEDRPARDRIDPTGDDAERLARSVRIEGRDAPPALGRTPALH
jgi:hypothetical protein